MMRKILVLFVLFLFSNLAFGQLNPEIQKKAIVKVYVITNSNKASVLTGFLWKNTKTVITSLHGMRLGGKIKVVYNLDNGGQLSSSDAVDAVVARVYKDADLVQLKVTGDVSATNIASINSYSTKATKYNDAILGLGYNSGAKGISSRSLKVGYNSSNTLYELVPKKDRKEIQEHGMPNIKLPIIYVEGSLLPGFSGAPMFNQNGDLIGIGDGGLENGASNVSWVIPAKYIENLENSTLAVLPSNLSKASQSFSADVDISGDFSDKNSENLTTAVEAAANNDYKTMEINGFVFHKTKTRNLYDLMETSNDNDEIGYIVNLFSDVDFDFDNIYFDIYEDVDKGVILVMPQGKFLTKSDEQNAFGDLNVQFASNKDFSLEFSLDKMSDVEDALSDQEFRNNVISLAKENDEDIDPDNNMQMLEYVFRYFLMQDIEKSIGKNDRIVPDDSLYYIQLDDENSLLTRQMYFIEGTDEDGNSLTSGIYYFLTLAADESVVSALGHVDLTGDLDAKDVLELLLSVHLTTILSYNDEETPDDGEYYDDNDNDDGGGE